MASIDKMGWHYGADGFPANLPAESAGTHIGLYLTWIIENDMIGEGHREEAKEEIQKVLTHEWSGRDFLIEVCDEVFWKADLNETGRQFTAAYYGSKGYYRDYEKLLPAGVNFYALTNSWENYERVKEQIAKRYAAWQAKQKHWWLRWFK